MVEYALKDINKPLGISEYQLTEILPKEFKSIYFHKFDNFEFRIFIINDLKTLIMPVK